jgi:late competence protein required for DNA uptake (superfamily II DNA/RNA helicase)
VLSGKLIGTADRLLRRFEGNAQSQQLGNDVQACAFIKDVASLPQYIAKFAEQQVRRGQPVVLFDKSVSDLQSLFAVLLR